MAYVSRHAGTDGGHRGRCSRNERCVPAAATRSARELRSSCSSEARSPRIRRAVSPTSSAGSSTRPMISSRDPPPNTVRTASMSALRTRSSQSISAAARVTVRSTEPDAPTEDHPFDQLVFANGAKPIRPDLPNAHADGIHGIQTISDGIALRDHVERSQHPKVVVVGGGYVGLEMAEAMRVRELDVIMVDRSAQPMNSLDEDMGAMVTDALVGLGVDVHLSTAVTGFETDGGVSALVPPTRGRSPPTSWCWDGVARDRDRARGRDHHRTYGWRRHRPPHGDERRGRVGGRRLRGNAPPTHREAGGNRARHPREQTGQGSGDERCPAGTRRSLASSAPRSPRCAILRLRARA